MFIPYLFLDLREQFVESIKEKDSHTLTPSAQLIILHHLYGLRNGLVDGITSFKELAALLDYSAMAITKAATDLNRYLVFARKISPYLDSGNWIPHLPRFVLKQVLFICELFIIIL